MSNPNLIVKRVKQIAILCAFFLAAAWLVRCGESYDDRRNSILPIMMCAIESILLVITGAAIAGRAVDRGVDRSVDREKDSAVSYF